jgi:hypothetical protein
MRENSIRFEFVFLRASDIVIQTPFGTLVTLVPGSRSRHLHPPRYARGPAGAASGKQPDAAPP